MAFSSFAITFTFLMCLQGTRLTLLSRFRNPNEYVAPAEQLVLPEELSDDAYNDLIEEVPEITYSYRNKVVTRTDTKNRTAMPYLIYMRSQEPPVEPYYPQGDREDELDSVTEPLEFSSVTQAMDKEQIENLTTSTTITSTRPPWFTGPHMATCYTCGLNSSFVPHSTLCHEIFESDDFSFRTMARYLRTKCYRNTEYWAQRIEDFYFHGRHYRTDLGLKRGLYGPYIGGCFKRFMDVGTVYTQRGCRTWWPTYPHFSNFASRRYTRLEALLKHQKNACVVSPHASLTPFSRTISLFVRYHVCVCEGRYCNTAKSGVSNHLLVLTLIYIVA